ncbi:hypothetical protein ORI20_13820 [Mycobacterium sp. CVI_P3]|uniref:Uncharacterized protein n=1 Tax=Mycobacterium pinniadriaticum TaxID=2994102 RepID=A0ABT3SE47_9MYCO|nr:hypothetical protein [Mycobacterium pinniadriaticum]MCX2931357.1 hypothetical protein [Mycobacterium pinniadriaticum]MCX2937781.1 hypothetical protein [Mycobacterium pinniadriaticum]
MSETTHMARFEDYGVPVPAVVGGRHPGLASAFAAADLRGEQLQAAITEIREQCDDAADLGSHVIYIDVIDSILKRHGLK